MKAKIIILQTSQYGLDNCKNLMESLGLQDKIDFILLKNFSNISEEISPYYRQLLITGSIRNNSSGVAKFVSQAREVNPQLVCISYASMYINGPFERVITKEKNDSLAELRESMEDFFYKPQCLIRVVTEWELLKLKSVYT